MIINPLKGVAQSTLAEVRCQRSSTAQLFLDLTELGRICRIWGVCRARLNSRADDYNPCRTGVGGRGGDHAVSLISQARLRR